MNAIEDIVNLYRAAGRPIWSNRRFKISVNYCESVHDLISKLYDSSITILDEVVFDGKLYCIGESDEIPTTWSHVELTCIPPSRSENKFYSNVDDLLSTDSVKKGTLPNSYYLVDIDYYSNDNKKPDEILKLEGLCIFINQLSTLAHYHDSRDSDDSYKLVFINNNDNGKSTSAILNIELIKDLIYVENADYSILEYFNNPQSKSTPHYHEKIGIFRNTIVEFVCENKVSFQDLVKNWSDFNKLYQDNLATYLNNFSFHKARKEVAEAETNFAEKLSKITSDIAGKILSIPISMAAAIAILKLSDIKEISLAVISIIITSIFIHFILLNQYKQLNRVIHAKDLVFRPFENDEKTYPSELLNDVLEALTNLNKNQKFAKTTLEWLIFITWIPSAISVILLLDFIMR
ncbi:hypothetical protein [Providencia huaxiensis]|uniref:Uncharacterized protein n=1 Tax=Providencia huaxiensis TaxID=2027290 RepID=A0A8I2AH39_9GAMM|nr:hypothetical protein [Providencia huaxiensis]MBQ0266757.1 hypothetical protein [Providencia huaxiensis]